MINLNKKIYNLLFLFILVLFSCSKQDIKLNNIVKNDCSFSKTHLLVNEIMNKPYFFPLINNFYEKDSSLRYNYIYSENINLEKSEYYAKVIYKDDKIRFDSLKIKTIKNRNAFYMDANVLIIKLDSMNTDTSEVKVSISYGLYNNMAVYSSDYKFVFDENKCKWYVKDSIFNEY